jgi:small subunit ribosomal protein S9
VTDDLKVPFLGVEHARPVPISPSYFSREPQFNDLYLDITKLLAKYNHLPTIPNSEAPQLPWTKLPLMRAELGEQIKASHFAKVIRVAKRLNLIEPTLRPAEVSEALTRFTRGIDHRLNVSTTIRIDRFGRALGVGRRKASTARAFIVEGTGEVFVNGKPITDVFGRPHDRESVLWALLATARMDKYNVWAMVEGGGTTGQAEALAMAVAKGLIGHEPALKPALKRGEFICFDLPDTPRWDWMLLPQSSFVICETRADQSFFSQRVSSLEITERWRGRSMAASRLARPPPGSSVKSRALAVVSIWQRVIYHEHSGKALSQVSGGNAENQWSGVCIHVTCVILELTIFVRTRDTERSVVKPRALLRADK